MTKRQLIKWIQNEKVTALEDVRKQRDKGIDCMKSFFMNKVNAEQTIDDLYPILSQLKDVLDSYIGRVAEVGGAHFNQYGNNSLYRNILNLQTKEEITKWLSDSTSFGGNSTYASTRMKLISEVQKVEYAYNTVIETLQNLPNAKSGIEYLVKLGFDPSKIVVEENKKLPTTVTVNVDTQYLMLNQSKGESE